MLDARVFRGVATIGHRFKNNLELGISLQAHHDLGQSYNFVERFDRTDPATDRATGVKHGQLSADEKAYLRLARDMTERGHWGDLGLKQPFRWAPGTPVLFAAASKLSVGWPATSKKSSE